MDEAEILKQKGIAAKLPGLPRKKVD